MEYLYTSIGANNAQPYTKDDWPHNLLHFPLDKKNLFSCPCHQPLAKQHEKLVILHQPYVGKLSYADVLVGQG